MTLPQLLSHARTWLPGFAFETVFDVGAGVGKGTAAVLDEHPGAVVHALTPVRASLAALGEAAGGSPNVRPYRIALGFSPEPLKLQLAGAKTARQLSEAGEEADLGGVAVTRGDIFCREHGIARISFLNIETGELDLDVLRGFGLMLTDGRIGLIQVDCGMTPPGKWPGLREFLDLLEPLGFQLFHIYDQKMMRHGYPALRSARCAFVAPHTALEAQARRLQAKRSASRM